MRAYLGVIYKKAAKNMYCEKIKENYMENKKYALYTFLMNVSY